MSLHWDASNSNLQAERVVEAVLARLFTKKFAPVKFRQFVPINHEVPAGAETFAYYLLEETGDAAITKDYADDAPAVDATKQKFSRFIVPIRDQFGYSMQELANAAMPGGMPIDSTKASIAFNAIERKHNTVALVGYSPVGWEGLFNLSDTSLGSGNGPVPVTPSTGLTGTWSAADPDEIISDVQALATKIEVDTLENYEATDLILPNAKYSLLKTRRLGDASNMTLLAYLQANFPGLNISYSLKLIGAGGSSTDRMVMYSKTPDVLEYFIPQEFEALAPQLRGHIYTVHCHSRTGGLQVRIPKAIAYGDGI